MQLATGLLHAADRPETPSSSMAKSPPLKVITIDGKMIEVHKQIGKVVLVDFMTTTCPSCRQASVAIQKMYRELGDKGFLPIAVGLDAQASSLLPFYRNSHDLTFPMGTLPRDSVLKYLDHPADKPLFVPILVLLDKDGRIAMKQVGWSGDQQLRSAVTKLITRRR